MPARSLLLFPLAFGGLLWAQSELLDKANQAYRSGRPMEAIQTYRKYLEADPTRADVRVFLGAALLNLNQIDEAAEQARQAIASDSHLVSAHTLAGRVLAARRLWQGAQAEFALAKQLDPDNRDLAYFAGRAFLDADRPEDAIRQFRYAIALGSAPSRVYENLAIAYAEQGDLKLADVNYRQSVALAGRNFHPFYAYGLFLFEQQRLAESETMLQDALRREDQNSGVQFALARLLFHKGEIGKAAEVLEPAKDSQDCRVHSLLSRIYLRQRKNAEAELEENALRSCRLNVGQP